MTGSPPSEWPAPKRAPSTVTVTRRVITGAMGLPLWMKIAIPIGVIGAIGAIGGSDDEKTTSTRAIVSPSEAASTTTEPQTTVAVATTATPTTAPQTTVAVATTQPQPPPTVALVQPPATTAAPSKLDPQFGTCKEAKSHGYGPYRQGVDPEYNWYRDADNDGVVCE